MNNKSKTKSESTPETSKKLVNGDVKQTIKKTEDKKDITSTKGAAAATTVLVSETNGTTSKPSTTSKLPPRPLDYDYYWYQDEDGNWRNEYDDYGLFHL